ncbi:hypothetical protein [Formosa sp. PL04]|uniref:hypothetical protein n=1 Tax=Formosa sp. PL04 TaxID=3081755 RepID=UPI0029819B05|nr:hypothetical protein [Formosa sp. PL04]MDW5288881.1 hypothetical protein [Formosa sp. PL04]
MKTILTTVIYFIIIITGFAQNDLGSNEHMVFKGVPIDGTLSEYVSKLEKKGLNNLQTENGVALLNGDVAGYNDCYLVVSTISQKDLVYVLVVMFPVKDTWSTLSYTYSDLKEKLTGKYGEPSEVTEEFNSNFEPDSDADKLYEVRNNNCIYHTIFHSENGGIDLSINYDRDSGYFVKLVYVDLKNTEIINEINNNDL